MTEASDQLQSLWQAYTRAEGSPVFHGSHQTVCGRPLLDEGAPVIQKVTIQSAVVFTWAKGPTSHPGGPPQSAAVYNGQSGPPVFQVAHHSL